MRASLRRSLVIVLAFGLTATGAAGERLAAPKTLFDKLERALAVRGLNRSLEAAVAFDLQTGKVLFKRRQYVPLEPASNEKLTVTFAALKTFGPQFRMHTDVLGDGGQAGDVWHGNLVLRGGGDPTLSSRALKRLAWLVRGAGIRHVTGSVLGDETFFDARRGVWGWKSSFYGIESPPLSALSVNRGVYRGRLSASPAAAAAALFRKALRSAGVSVQGRSRLGKASKAAVPLAHVNSPPLWKILRFMDTWSDNFTAELVLKQLGATAEGQGTSAAGATVVRRALEASNVPLAGVRIVDGSGLSVRDRLTGAALVGILRAAWSDPAVRKPFESALAIAGHTGTLRSRLVGKRTKGHIVAKTGTTDEASALSGFVNGRYAFAVVHNGHPLASWYAKQAEDRFVTVLAGAPK